MKKILIWIVLVAALGAGFVWYGNLGEATSQPAEALVDGVTSAAENVSSEEIYLKPVEFSIPKLGLSTDVEHVLEDAAGRMDVPKDWNNVGWWSLGSKPGEVGSAVIAGHLDNPDGTPSVFYGLERLVVGDEVFVTDTEGKQLTFSVVDSAVYQDATFPIDKVFAQTDGRRLNLITCAGTFDRTARNYSDRYVVFTELVE